MHRENPEREQDRAEDLLDNWRKYGYVMFPQQRRIYEQVAEKVCGNRVLEVGCGNGVGSVLLNRRAARLIATDKLERNARFARELYPWINFGIWDVLNPGPNLPRFEVVVAVEVLEHVADPAKAMKNLIASAIKEVWLSTPNGRGKPRPPANPFHVAEYTVAEMRAMIADAGGEAVEVLSWESFLPLADDTDVDPLVYKVTL